MTLVVDTGAPARIASVRITVTGPASVDSPLGTETIARITKRMERFPRARCSSRKPWTLAKERAINTLTGSPYAAARIARSEALIDPERASADLTIELASGPAFGFGQFEITGLYEIRTVGRAQLQHDRAGNAVQRCRAQPVRPAA